MTPGKGLHRYKSAGARIANFIKFILYIHDYISVRPNYFIFMGYLIAGRGN